MGNSSRSRGIFPSRTAHVVPSGWKTVRNLAKSKPTLLLESRIEPPMGAPEPHASPSTNFVDGPGADDLGGPLDGSRLRVDGDLQYAVLLVAEQIERSLDVVERKPVRHEGP